MCELIVFFDCSCINFGDNRCNIFFDLFDRCKEVLFTQKSYWQAINFPTVLWNVMYHGSQYGKGAYYKKENVKWLQLFQYLVKMNRKFTRTDQNAQIFNEIGKKVVVEGVQRRFKSSGLLSIVSKSFVLKVQEVQKFKSSKVEEMK